MENLGIKIIDCTLREGNQCPGVNFSIEQSVKVAHTLSSLHVSMIEIGHPLATPLEWMRVKAVVDLGLMEVLSHARANLKDIKAVADTGAPWVGIFAGVNDVSQKDRFQKNKCEILRMVREGVAVAKDYGLKVRYTPEDSSRTNQSDLLEAYGVAIAAGADRVCFADTLGLMIPSKLPGIISLIKKEFPATPLEVHLHDDRGMAMANAIACIQSGADWISSSINGIGERVGITDTLALIANLAYEGYFPITSLAGLRDASESVARITSIPVDARRPVTGRNAFIHTARLHTQTTSRNKNAYNWIDPTFLKK